MAILEKEVWINLAGNNEYYESKGYTIPRETDKWGRSRTPRGSKILVDVNDLSLKSSVKVTKVCDDCGSQEPNKCYYLIMDIRKYWNGIDRCKQCVNIHIKMNKTNCPYERSLEHWAKTNNKEYLLDEFSDKNNIDPSKVFRASADNYLWDCPDCETVYDMRMSNKTKGQGCPYCSGKRVNKTNSLWATHPEIADLLVDKEIGNKVTQGSNRACSFSCRDCRHTKITMVCTVVRNGFACPLCSDGISYPEKFVASLLNQVDEKFNRSRVFEWSKNTIHTNHVLDGNKIYDFFIPSLNCIIETHGRQHYDDKNQFEKTYEEEHENDLIKRNLAKQNGIEKYIEIDCRYSTLEYLKRNILKSDLNSLYDLAKIDWLECHKFACSSMVKTVANLYNSGIRSAYKIADILNFERSTISKNYLKQAVELGWCDYDPKEQQRQSQKVTSKNRRKKVIQVSLTGEFIKEWVSAREIHRELNLCYKKISSVCKGKMNSVGNCLWFFEDDYEEYTKSGKSPIYTNSRKEVICLTNLKTYKTITEAGRSIDRAAQNIKANIIGKTDHCGIDPITGEKLKWMYKEDYEKYIEQQKQIS